MITPKSSNHYWYSFRCYQSFSSKDELMDNVSSIISAYELSPACKAVLNTIKLHSQQFFGVCWLKIAEIAKNAKVSVSSVNRSLKDLREAGFLTVHNWIHTTRGGKAHNVYVINPIEGSLELSSDTLVDLSNDTSSEVLSALEPQALQPTFLEHSNFNSNSNNNPNNNKNTKFNSKVREVELTIPEHFEKELNDQILTNIPTEFVDILSPFYSTQPEIIHARWRTLCSAVKASSIPWEEISWHTIKMAWSETVRRYKGGKLRNSDADGLGGYFYKAAADMIFKDYMESCLST